MRSPYRRLKRIKIENNTPIAHFYVFRGNQFIRLGPDEGLPTTRYIVQDIVQTIQMQFALWPGNQNLVLEQAKNMLLIYDFDETLSSTLLEGECYYELQKDSSRFSAQTDLMK